MEPRNDREPAVRRSHLHALPSLGHTHVILDLDVNARGDLDDHHLFPGATS